MGIPKGPEEVVLFVGSLFSVRDVHNATATILKEKFGNLLFESPPLPWNYTDYYAGELRPPLYKGFFFFDAIIDPSFLVDAKLATNEIELNSSADNRRKINLDPGYMSLAKVVLASTKNYSHRIYLGKGIYGELELIYKDGRFNTLPYTYPDYRDETCLKIFIKARGLLKKILASS